MIGLMELQIVFHLIKILSYLKKERNALKGIFQRGRQEKLLALSMLDNFGSADSIEDRGTMDPKMWWLVHGASTPNIRK